jgi:hypothetical protein
MAWHLVKHKDNFTLFIYEDSQLQVQFLESVEIIQKKLQLVTSHCL